MLYNPYGNRKVKIFVDFKEVAIDTLTMNKEK